MRPILDARRHSRFPISSVKYRAAFAVGDDFIQDVDLLNISLGGFCLKMTPALSSIVESHSQLNDLVIFFGSKHIVILDNGKATVKWHRYGESMGGEFQKISKEAIDFLGKRFQRLRKGQQDS